MFKYCTAPYGKSIHLQYRYEKSADGLFELGSARNSNQLESVTSSCHFIVAVRVIYVS